MSWSEKIRRGLLPGYARVQDGIKRRKAEEAGRIEGAKKYAIARVVEQFTAFANPETDLNPPARIRSLAYTLSNWANYLKDMGVYASQDEAKKFIYSNPDVKRLYKEVLEVATRMHRESHAQDLGGLLQEDKKFRDSIS